MALAQGTPAPVISLKRKTAEGIENVTVDYKNGKKTVLLFFPMAFTSVCQEELCSISGGINEYESLDAEVFGISVDSPFAQEAFAKQAGITIPLLSDFNKATSTAFDVIYETFLPGVLDLQGVSKRSAFVIDANGTIAYSWSSDDAKNLPPFNELKAALEG